MSSRGRDRKRKRAPVTSSDIGNSRVAIIPSTSSSASPPPKKRKVGKAKAEANKTKKVKRANKTKKVKRVYPYQNLIAKVKMIRIRPNEDSLTEIVASGDETYMTSSLAEKTTADWKGSHPMWRDNKKLVLFEDCDTKSQVVMVMPGEEESHRLFNKKPVHTPNLLASAIVDEFFGAFYLGPDASNSIHGTVYIYEECYNPDDDYDEEMEDICEEKEEPVTDLSDESIARLKKVWGLDEDEDDEDDEDDDE
jgi:hypothetical protein